MSSHRAPGAIALQRLAVWALWRIASSTCGSGALPVSFMFDVVAAAAGAEETAEAMAPFGRYGPLQFP